jgi:hypothetical protein
MKKKKLIELVEFFADELLGELIENRALLSHIETAEKEIERLNIVLAHIEAKYDKRLRDEPDS